MRKLHGLALFGLAGLAAGGAAVAASPTKHQMNVALPDGSVAHIEYYGDVAPKVTIARRPYASARAGVPAMDPVQRMMAQMERQRAVMEMRANQLSRQANIGERAPATAVSLGNAPAGSRSVSVVSINNGGKTCTRTTEVTSQGEGRPAKVVRKASGDCSEAEASPAPTVPQAPAPAPQARPSGGQKPAARIVRT